MKKPDECVSLLEIREAIDTIDKKVIQLLGERFSFVKAAAKFKKDQSSVKAEDRVNSMISVRRDWAVENNLDPDFIETTYRNLIAYFVGEELSKWKDTNK